MSFGDDIRNNYRLRKEQIYQSNPLLAGLAQEEERQELPKTKLQFIQRELEKKLKIKKEPDLLGINEVDGFEGSMLRDYLESIIPPQKTISLSFNGESLSSINFG